jgi:DNA polymerase-1
MQRVYDSEYSTDIHPIASIHDSLYFIIKDTPEVLKFTNDNLIECMSWQDHPEIYHSEVKLGAELVIHYPTWADEIPLENNASIDNIKDIILAINICNSNR